MELADCVSQPLKVPAEAEIVIEGEVSLTDYRDEGPYGDHTGYYNSVEQFPVFTVTAITMRKDPIYLSTYTARPPDEPSILGEALNEVFIPLLKQQFPEIVDFWLPPEGCSYRIAVVSMKKAYPGHAKRVMMAVWSYLRQFMYTKWVIVVDDDINARDWKDVMWAVSTRMDPARDVTLIENTPIDYLDFASPEIGLGSKIGLDATNKLPPETHREWGRKIAMDEDVIRVQLKGFRGPAGQRQTRSGEFEAPPPFPRGWGGIFKFFSVFFWGGFFAPPPGPPRGGGGGPLEKVNPLLFFWGPQKEEKEFSHTDQRQGPALPVRYWRRDHHDGKARCIGFEPAHPSGKFRNLRPRRPHFPRSKHRLHNSRWDICAATT